MKIKSKVSYIYAEETTGASRDRKRFTKIRIKDSENKLMTQRVVGAIARYDKISIDRELVMEILENVSNSIKQSHEIAVIVGIDAYSEYLDVLGVTSGVGEPLSSYIWLSMLEFVPHDEDAELREVVHVEELAQRDEDAELREEARKAAKEAYYKHCGELGYTYQLVAEALKLERKLRRFDEKYEPMTERLASSIVDNESNCIKKFINIERNMLKKEA